MKHLCLLACLFLLPSLTIGQKTTIYLDHSDKLEFNNDVWPDCQILTGNVQFRHEDMLMYCDSAYFYDKRNEIIAVGNIKMNQRDSLFVYGDKLFYDGNIRLARLRHNVRMENNQAILYTDSLNYDRKRNVGYYFNGGKIVDSTNVLVSVKGRYYPNTDLAVFQKDIVLTNPDFILTSDTLHYNTRTDIATILGPSDIVYHDSTFIYAENGWYDTQNDIAFLTQNPAIHDLEGHFLAADTLFHNHNTHHTEAFTKVCLSDTIQHMIIKGDYGWYNDQRQEALVTKVPTLYYIQNTASSQDTLYITADTMQYADNTQQYVKSYRNVQSWRADFQSIADSAFYSSLDSTLYLYGSPVMWNDSNQHTGSEIHLKMAGDAIERVYLENNAFVYSKTDSVVINQMSGKQIVGYFNNKHMYKTEVIGNARSVYFVEDTPETEQEAATYSGINRCESSQLVMYINDNNSIKKVVMSPASNGTLHTIDKINQEKITRLEGFHDYQNLRPRSKEDIYIPKNKETLKADTAANKVRKRRRSNY